MDKIVILCGPRPTYGHSPLPPLTNSAPERNIFRIAEGHYRDELEIHVISTCNNKQKIILDASDHTQQFHNLLIPNFISKILNWGLLNNRYISAICSRILYTYDLYTYYYLIRASRVIRKINPELIIINSLPQYIHFIHHNFSNKKLGAFVRGEIGMSRKFLSMLDFIITNSKGITNYVVKLLKGQSMQIYEIPNSLEFSFCRDLKNNKSKMGRTLIFVGRIEPVKGVLELVQAFHHLTYSLNGIKLLIVGGNFGKSNLTIYEEKIKNYIDEHQLPVELIGQVPNSQLPKLYKKADIAIFPSIWLESFGMVALEAMRCGLPVIASKRPGFEELVEHAKTGLLVEDPTNTDDLANTIYSLMTNKILMRKMGQLAYQKSMDFTPEQTNQLFLKIIKQELAKNHG